MLIVAGRGIRLANAIDELYNCSLWTPTIVTILGRDLLPDNRIFGTIGIRGSAMEIVAKTDYIYFIGCSMTIAQLGYDLSIYKNKGICSVNIEPPNGLIECEWINKDAKIWLRECCGLKN